jgi:hypothetical protein
MKFLKNSERKSETTALYMHKNNMHIVELVDGRKYEVDSCTHCHNDTVEYNSADEPWHDEQWICGVCYSTFVIFNEQIAKQL